MPINGPNNVVPGPATVPHAMGPGGVPVSARAPNMASSDVPDGADAARAAFATQVPPQIVQQVAAHNNDPGLMLAGGPQMPPPPGAMPPPPGGVAPVGNYPPAAVAAVGALNGAYAGQFAAARTSVRFTDPRGMKVSWMIPSADGKRLWNDKPLEAPATYNFTQAAIYRLKLSDIPDYPGVDLYPTLEVVPANHRAMTFLAHSSVPVSFSPDDFRMVSSGNYVVKVIYLPDPQYQDIAVGGGLGELISTQLDPGVDPIAEACKRGSILLIVRLGNIDLELRHSPPMDAPPPHAPGHAGGMPPGGMPPGGMPPGMGMLPPGMMPPGMMPPGMMPPGMTGGPGRGMATPPPGFVPGNVGAPSGPPVGLNTGNGALPPLPPQTNPLTPAQLAGQQGR
jgi:hypothetical protein